MSQFQLKQVVINNKGNIGKSAALNVGIKATKRLGFEMVALFDQDTDLPLNFTQQMLHYINQYQGDKPVAHLLATFSMTIKKLSKNQVCAIVVTYKTNQVDFKINLHQLQKNYNLSIIVNNDKFLDISQFKSKKVMIINNNKGLSIALNQGIKLAKSLNYLVVALFDQDSFIPNNFNEQMLSNIRLINNKEPQLNVAVYGSQFINKKTNKKLEVINIGVLRLITKKTSQHNIYDFPSWLITSGSYIPLDLFDELDYFDENLFIDYIDIEWCLRAHKAGYSFALFNNINFRHDLGDRYVHFFSRYLYIHSPLRTYYTTRNSVYLFSLKHISLNFFITDQIRNFLKFCFTFILDKHRILDSVKYFFLGYYHGLIKKMGKLEE